MRELLWQIYGPRLAEVARILVVTSVFWLPVLLAIVAARLWIYHARAQWLKTREWILLEIKLPQEIAKTPAAMELVLLAMHVPVDAGNVIAKWIKGELRIWSSLELISVGGVVRFFIRIEKGLKNRVESAIYSQFPNVEIYEAADYTNEVPYGLPNAGWKMMGSEFAFTQKEDAYPIKTYVDYGLDRPTPPEGESAKVDPLTPVIEFLGTLKPEEQIWIQIPIMATRKRFPKKGAWFEKQDWVANAKETIEKIRTGGKKGDDKDKPVFLTPGENETLKAIERSLGKQAFDCIIRVIYLAPEDKFNNSNIGGMISSITQFGSPGLNGFKPDNITGVKYPWQDLTGRKVALKKAVMFDAYRRRSAFYPPYVRKQMVLTTEEVATLYHFPGAVARTPGLPKIESKRGQPPTNLPGV